MDLHLLSFVPKYDPKYNSNDYCSENTNGVILWIPPVAPILLPETSFALSKKGLRVLCWETEVLGTWWWGTQFFHKFLVTPEKCFDDSDYLKMQKIY